MSQQIDSGFLVGAIRTSTAEVFSTMMGIEVTAGEPILNTTEAGPTQGVVGIIGMAGSYVGTGMICCNVPLACRAASAMMMSEYDSVNDEVLDAVGEICNMIVGNIKTAIEERYGEMGISVPTVVYGHNFATRTLSKGSWTIVPFETNGDKIEIFVSLVPNSHSDSGLRPGFRRTEPVLA